MPNTYTTPELVVARLPRQVYALLGVDDGADVSADPVLLAAIETANDVVDSYLRGRYSLPLPSVSAALVSAATDLVKWELVKNRHDVRSEGDETDFDNAIRFLKETRLGEDARVSTAPVPAPVAADVVKLGGESTGGAMSEPWTEEF